VFLDFNKNALLFDTLICGVYVYIQINERDIYGDFLDYAFFF